MITRLTITAVLAVLTLCGSAYAKPDVATDAVVFEWTDLSGRHMFDEPDRFPFKPDASRYTNPILPGFYPDPSIERVGDDYYLINSSFAYYPGIPVFHSKDLVNWKQIGNAIDRPGMLDFSGLATSRGVFAPDLSYHNGTFYILNTCVDCKGNFIITAKDPKGPWSDPVFLPFDGIDPALIFDGDKAYIVNNGGPDGPELYSGHRAIWMQEFDVKTNRLIGPRKALVNGGVDISKKPIWIEGPHIFKKDGFYYLIAAEGGTAEGHSQVVFRSKDIWGPYVAGASNPILTQRYLDPNRRNAITSAGHADFVQTPNGDWWAVFLATRPYAPGLYNTGRETFLLPVTWKDGWPTILEPGKAIPFTAALPAIATPPAKAPDRIFDTTAGIYSTGMDWLMIRTPKDDFLKVLSPRKLSLKARPEAIGNVASHPSFIGLRQTQNWNELSTIMHLTAPTEGTRAGLVAIQNDEHYVFCGLTQKAGKTKVITAMRRGAADPVEGVITSEADITVAPGRALQLGLGVQKGIYYCRYLDVPQGQNFQASMMTLIDNADATFLSTQKAGGFVGTLMGLYAYRPKN